VVLISTTSKLIETLSDLVRIQSINPAYEGGLGEAELQQYVAERFRAVDLETFEQEVFEGRSNVIGILPGRDRNRRIVFEAHGDTVGIEGMTIEPFCAEIRNGRLFGRGACDTKGGMAAMMHAVIDLKRSGVVPHCDVWVAAVVDEEYTYRGVVRLCENLSASAAVIAEPTDMRLVSASKGCLRFRIRVGGKAAHSSKPHLGVNAIQGMMRVLRALEIDEDRLERICHPLVGKATWNVGRIEGGTQVNVVPADCVVEVDRRLIPGEDPTRVKSQYERLLVDLRNESPTLDATLEEPFLTDWPLDTASDSNVVKLLSEILKNRKLPSEPSGAAFGSDASKFAQAGIPSLILGPGSIDQAHTADEYVDIDQVEEALLVYRDLMLGYE
jgi:acetylornithine deacetylase/succinyl-diaminopimelate desuccinylase family protein